MKYKVFKRHPGTGYRDNWLWLPKREVNATMLKNSLEFYLPNGKSESMWREEENHILVPRELKSLPKVDFEIKNLTPEHQKINIKSSIELDALWPDQSIQRDAYADLVTSDKGILNLACGRGKTIIFLHAAANWKEPLLVITGQEHILLQWKKAVKDFLEIDGEIGHIQGNPRKWNWKQPITLAMLKSLANHADKIPMELAKWPGRIVWDEIHHLSAPSYSRTAAVFWGKRYGASATVNRPDGAEIIYFNHVGPVVHQNLSQDIVPSVIFKRSHVEININDREVRKQCCSRTGDIHFRKAASYVGTLPEELKLCEDVVRRGVEKGRRMLVLSLSRDQTIAMHERFPDSGIVISGNPRKAKDRLEVIANKKLIFATADLGREALDEARLDSLVILNEFSDDNLLQQAVGRVQRKLREGTKAPSKVVIIFHVRVPSMRAMGANLKKHFRRWGIETETIG